MSGADRSKVLIAGGVALVAIVVIVFFVLRGRGGGERAAGGGAFTAETAAVEEGAAGTPAPGTVGEGEGAAEAGAEAGEEGAVGPARDVFMGRVEVATGPTEPSRPDPFQTFEPPPQPTPPELLVSMPAVGLTPGGLRPGGPSEVAAVGDRRVAGLVYNDEVYAILVDGEEEFIVKPGDVVDGIRITAIARDGLFLRDSEGQRWEVPLRGLGPGAGEARESVVAGR
jgi:hypothetical protein